MDVKLLLEAVACCYEAVIDESRWLEAVDRHFVMPVWQKSAVINYFNFESGVAHDPYALPDLAFTFFSSNLEQRLIADYAIKTAASEGALYSEIQGIDAKRSKW